MKAKFIGKEKNTASFEMTFTAEEFDKSVDAAYAKNKGKYVVDGFRKGKAPKKIIETRYGEGIFYEDAINNLINENYLPAIIELDLSPVDKPSVDFEDIQRGKEFVVKVDVTVKPEFTLGKYKGVEVAKIEHTIADEDVQKELESVQKRNGRVITVEREAKDGDTVRMDYAGFCADDQFEGGTADDQLLTLGSGAFIPGFEEQLIGSKAGDHVDVKVTFPEEYHAENLAGKDAIFKVDVKEVKETELPAIDDEFAKDVSEFDSLDEYKADIKAKLETAATEKAEYELKNSILEKIYEATEIDIPEAMVDEQLAEMIEEFSMQLGQQGMKIEDYFRYLGKEMDEFKADIRPDAYRKVKTKIIVDEIIVVEKIEATEADVEEELAKIAEHYKIPVESLKEQFVGANKNMLEQDVKARKAVDMLVAEAVIA